MLAARSWLRSGRGVAWPPCLRRTRPHPFAARRSAGPGRLPRRTPVTEVSASPVVISNILPVIMLAIIFGLSSDYEMFVVSRIKEDYTSNGDARRAVQRGTALSARVVTVAALIMFSIFVAFTFTSDPTIKAIGFSFAAGVFLDAFVVRLTLVPAIMAITGSRIWYQPQWFARHIPDPDIEGQRLAPKPAQRELAAAGTSARAG